LALCRRFVDVTGFSRHKQVKKIFDAVFGRDIGNVSELVVGQRIWR